MSDRQQFAPRGLSFARRVADLELSLDLLYVKPEEIVRELITCIREQQAALAAVTEAIDNYSVDLFKREGRLIPNGLAEAQIEARAVRAKYALEGK